MMRRDVFQAIADPTRRAIIDRLSRQSLNLNTIADTFDISRQAVSKQIRILSECGLVEISRQGRERFCKARLEPLQEITNWTEQYARFWNDKLDALETHLSGKSTKKTSLTSKIDKL